MTRLPSSVFLVLLLAAPSAAQDTVQQPSAPQREQEMLEQDYIRTRIENGDSHASGARPELGPVVLGNPTQAVVALRVGLSSSTFNATGALTAEFGTLHHASVELTNTDGDVKVIDRSSGREITVMTVGSVVRVGFDGTSFSVAQDGMSIGSFTGPVLFKPASGANLFRVESTRRTYNAVTAKPTYRGAMEVAPGRGQYATRMYLVNIVEVEDYVPGVVANESIASFSMEALKAQAVAARGYAIANVGNYVARNYPFDIVDTTASQVYRGVISEHPRAVQAASETIGLVVSYGSRIIGALYSSSFGGHSENNEWIFNSPSSQLPGSNASPYLRAIYDGSSVVPPDFTTESGISDFWTTNPKPDIYDECTITGNGFSRWTFTMAASVMKSRLTASNSVVMSGMRGGDIADIAITQRMPGSGRAAVATITLTTGVLEVRGWDNLRQVIGKTPPQPTPSTPRFARACGTSTIAWNFVLNNPSVIELTKNPDGKVSQVTVYGGGWGHNLGMSQYGAHGRAKAGQGFLEILKAYYTGVDIGSYPIDIGREPGSGAPLLRQQFVAPNATGRLVIRATDLAGLRVHVNELYDLSFDQAALAGGTLIVDISRYLIAGLNVIQFNPVGRNGSATVNVVVE